MNDFSSAKGIVYLVGAGPGDPGLLTVRGRQCLELAHVVVYDNLANPELLNWVPADCERIFAGKMADQHTKSQDEINAILLDRARQGKTVVRLKGGDPFVFGRGGEEARYLAEHGIEWQVVPGITSAIAAPAYAGIPVTHRGLAGDLHIVTGHESDDPDGATVNWPALAQCEGTIVFLMGVKNLEYIVGELMDNGRPPDTPIALVHWGTMPEQETLISTLDRVVDDSRAAHVKPPVVGIVGDVVNLRQHLAWYEQRALAGLRIAVTRPYDENRRLQDRLYADGAHVAVTPTLRVVPLVPDGAGKKLVKLLADGHYDWLVLTSANGVRHLTGYLLATGCDLRALAGCRIAAIGERTALALRDVGLAPDLVAGNATQEGIAAELTARHPKRVLIARATLARPVLENLLHQGGINSDILPLYETVPNVTGIAHLKDLLQQKKIDVITFTSARTFNSLAAACPGEELAHLLASVAVAVIGPVTRAAVEAAGVTVTMEAESADMDSLATSIAQWRRAPVSG